MKGNLRLATWQFAFAMGWVEDAGAEIVKRSCDQSFGGVVNSKLIGSFLSHGIGSGVVVVGEI